jgi:flavorubredoxin
LLRQYFPEVVIIGNNKTLSMVEGYYGLTDKTMEVKDGQILSLGINQLQFHFTPMVHWPETMMTFETTKQILFS